MSDIPFHENIDWEEQERLAEREQYICPYCTQKGWCENNFGAECQFEDYTADEAREIIISEMREWASWSSDRAFALKGEIHSFVKHLTEREVDTEKYSLLEDAWLQIHYIYKMMVEEENIDENNNEGEDRG